MKSDGGAVLMARLLGEKSERSGLLEDDSPNRGGKRKVRVAAVQSP